MPIAPGSFTPDVHRGVDPPPTQRLTTSRPAVTRLSRVPCQPGLTDAGERDHARCYQHLVLSVAAQLAVLVFALALDAVRLWCAGVLLVLCLGLAAQARLMCALPPSQGDAHGRQEDEPEDDRYPKTEESRPDRHQEHR